MNLKGLTGNEAAAEAARLARPEVITAYPITPQTSLKITIAKWLTPNGVSISDQGLEPDFKVEITKEDIELENDPPMEKAKEVVNNWKK